MTMTKLLSNITQTIKEKRLMFETPPESTPVQEVNKTLTGTASPDQLDKTKQWTDAEIAKGGFLQKAKGWIDDKSDHSPEFVKMVEEGIAGLKASYDKITWKDINKDDPAVLNFKTSLNGLVEKAEKNSQLDAAKKQLSTKKAEFESAKLTPAKEALADTKIAEIEKKGKMTEAMKPIVKKAIVDGLNGVEKEVIASIKDLETQLKGKEPKIEEITAAIAKLPINAAALLADRTSYPDANKMVLEVDEYCAAVTIVCIENVRYPFLEKKEVHAKTTKCIEKWKGIFDGYIANLATMPKKDALVDKCKQAQTEVVLTQVVNTMSEDDQAKLRTALKLPKGAEITPEKISSFFQKYASFEFTGAEAKSQVAELLAKAIQSQHLAVSITIEGGADSEAIGLVAANKSKIKELAESAKRIPTALLSGSTANPQLARHQAEITALAGAADAFAFVQTECAKSPADKAKWLGGGGVLNTLLAFRRSENIAGNADTSSLFKGTYILGVNPATTGGSKQANRYSQVSFLPAGSQLCASTTPATTASGAPAAGPGETPEQELARLKLEFKPYLQGVQSQVKDAKSKVNASSGSTQQVIDAKKGVEAILTAIQAIIGEDLNTADEPKIDALITAITAKADLIDKKGKLDAELAKLTPALQALDAANQAQSVSEARVDISHMEEGKEYTDIYGNKYKKEGGIFYYDGNKLPTDKPISAEETLKILTGRKAPNEADARAIATAKIPGIDLSNADVKFAYSFNLSTFVRDFTVTITHKTNTSIPAIEFVYSIEPGTTTATAGKENVTKLLKEKNDPPGSATKVLDITPAQRAEILGNGFTIDATRLSEGIAATDPQKQILEWIGAGKFREAMYGDSTVSPAKPGLLTSAGALNTGSSIDQVALCFNREPSITGTSDQIDRTTVFDLILPKLDINADYARISTYITDAKDRLKTVLETNGATFNGKLALATVRADIESLTDTDVTELDIVIAAFAANKNLSDALLTYNSATTPNDKTIIDLIVKRILSKGEALPAYLLSKVNTFADFIALAVPGFALNDVALKAKLGDLIIKGIQDDANLHKDANIVANFSALCAEVWGPAWATSAPEAVRAMGVALQALGTPATPGTPLDLSPTGLWPGMGDKSAFLTEVFKRVELANIDITKIKAVGHETFVKDELIPALEALAPTSKVASELLTQLVIEKAGNLTEAEQLPKLVDEFKRMENPVTPADTRIALARELGATSVASALKAKVLNGVDGSTASTDTQYNERVKKALNIALYDKAKEEQGGTASPPAYSTIDFTGTGSAASGPNEGIKPTDPRAMFVEGYKVAATGPFKKEFLTLVKDGTTYKPSQLEDLLRAAFQLLTTNPEAYLEVGLATGLLGHVDATIRTHFGTNEHLTNLWLSKVYPAEKVQYLTKAYEHIIAHASTITDMDELKVIEGCREADMDSVTVTGGTIIKIDEDPAGRLMMIKTIHAPGVVGRDPATYLKALEIFMQYEAGQCGAGEQHELMTEIDTYLTEKQRTSPLQPLTADDYATMEKALEGGVCSIDLATLAGRPDAQQAYGRILYNLAIKPGANPDHVAKFKALTDGTPDAAGNATQDYFEPISPNPVKAKWEELNGRDILSTPESGITDANAQQYVTAVLAAGVTPTEAQLKIAAKWAKDGVQLDAVAGKTANKTTKIEIYMNGEEKKLSSSTLTPFADTLQKALDIIAPSGAAIDATIAKVTVTTLINKVKAHASGTAQAPVLLEIITDSVYLDNATGAIGRDLIDTANVCPSGADAKGVWTAYKTLGNTTLLKDVTRKLVNAARSPALKLMNDTNSPSLISGGIITPPNDSTATASRTVRDLRDDIYDAYAPTRAEEDNVRTLLGIDV